MKMHTNRRQEAKLLPPDTFLIRKNAFAAGALPRTPLGSLQRSPDQADLLADNGGGAPGKGGGEKGEG